jgi:PAS domain S-box-containing protein
VAERRARRRSGPAPGAGSGPPAEPPVTPPASFTNAVVVTDLGGRVRSWNPAATALLHTTADDIVGRALSAADPGLLGRVGEAIGIVVAGLDNVAEWPLDAPDGLRRWVEVRATALGKAGTADTVLVALTDITEGRTREHDLRTRAVILAEVQDAIVVTDADARITYWNDGAAALFGYRADEMLGRTPDILFPAGAESPWTAQTGPRAGAEFDGDWLGVRNDGSTVWVRLHTRPLLDERGEIVGRMGIAADISDRHRVEFERARLATAVEQSHESIIITDAQARIVYVNPAFERLTGYSHDEVIGQNPRILKSGVQSATFYDAMWASLVSGQPWVADMTNRRKDGTLYREEAVFTPMRDATGAITGYVAVKRDVTRERELEAAGAAAARERALIAETLSRLPPGGSAEATGQAICQQIVSMTGLTHAHLFLFDDAAHATPIGLATVDGRSAENLLLPVARSRELYARASVGPWIEDWTERPGHPYNALLGELGVRAAAYLPVHRDHNLIGLLVVGATDDHATATLSTTFAGLVELADLAGALLASTVSARADSAHEITDSWALWWPVVDRLSLDVRVENEARATLERRFFGGHDVFFADAAEAWAGHVDFVERLASLADAIASTRNVKTSRRPPGWTVAEASVQARVAERVASLADDARVRAYEILGDRPRAVEIMERRLLAD